MRGCSPNRRRLWLNAATWAHTFACCSPRNKLASLSSSGILSNSSQGQHYTDLSVSKYSHFQSRIFSRGPFRLIGHRTPHPTHQLSSRSLCPRPSPSHSLGHQCEVHAGVVVLQRVNVLATKTWGSIEVHALQQPRRRVSLLEDHGVGLVVGLSSKRLNSRASWKPTEELRALWFLDVQVVACERLDCLRAPTQPFPLARVRNDVSVGRKKDGLSSP